MALRAPQLPPLPPKTATRGPHGYEQIPVPVPTSVPLRSYDLHQRQVVFEKSLTSVCGYISGNVCQSVDENDCGATANIARSAYPVTCDNAYCGYHYIFSVVGCCESYQTTLSSQVVMDWCDYNVACIDGDEFDGNCDEACQSNNMILKWYLNNESRGRRRADNLPVQRAMRPIVTPLVILVMATVVFHAEHLSRTTSFCRNPPLQE
jgi:hypothetical protein